jgi:hypothetical protein
VIGLAFQIGGCGRSGPKMRIVDRQPNEHEEVTDAIECSPPETTDCFENRVCDFADDLGWLKPFKVALSRLAENAARVEPVALFGFHHGCDSGYERT